jgi:hypothetical protein
MEQQSNIKMDISMISIPFVKVIIIYFQKNKKYEFYKQNFPQKNVNLCFKSFNTKHLMKYVDIRLGY